jgi:hypothetical protein
MIKKAEPVLEKQTKDPKEIRQFMEVLKSMAERILVPENTIKSTDLNHDGKTDGYEFHIANPFYTAESVASINTIELKVDGEKVDPASISLLVRDQRIPLENAKTMHEVWWGFGGLISVYVEKPNGLKKGKHELECNLRMRTTIAYGFPGGLLFPVKKTMFIA